MKNWRYKISEPRGIELHTTSTQLFNKLIEKVPSAKRCLLCGACSATCSASNHTDFHFHKCQLMFRRGQIENIAEELDKCMLCGKCKLACPRGVNTRAIIYNMRIVLNDIIDYKNILI